MNTSTVTDASKASLREDVRTISLVGLVHGISHFFHLLLPPLFPLLLHDFGFSYAELGLLVTTLFVVSGSGQAMAGFVVDRIGARPVLFAAMACFALSGLALSMATGYAGLMLAAALAGLGNCPFHPADFTILNRRVSAQRLGHAFSVHSLTGNLGWALAPVFLTGLATAFDSWRVAAAGASVLALSVLAVMWWQRDALDDSRGHAVHVPLSAARADPAAVAEHPMAFLRMPALWLCFSFFLWSSFALSAIQSFGSPALQHMAGLPLSTTSLVVTGFMLFGAVGIVIGGFLVTRSERLERIIGPCLLASAALLTLVGMGVVPGVWAVVLVAVAGFGVGIAMPSRDMLIKRAAPPGATGRVYGTVYSALDLGFALAAPLFGSLLDHGWPNGVFYGSALALALGVVSAAAVGSSLQRRRIAASTSAA
jgi:MFS family permease